MNAMTSADDVPRELPRALPHRFDEGNPAAERSTRVVLWITLAMMAAEIVGGWWFNSMAVLADGWHMSSHAVAMGAAWLAYVLARRGVDDPHFVWGTWKIEILAGYTSALLLVGVAVLMLWGSVERLMSPLSIHYGESIALAVVGLLVNLLCAWILHAAGSHHDHEDDEHAHHHEHGRDINLRAAFVHVLADALTSALAIVALLGGSSFGWDWLDPLAGVVGSVLVAVWAVGLMRSSAGVLLDRDVAGRAAEGVRQVLASNAAPRGVKLTDLHVWRVGRTRYACVVHLAAGDTALDLAEVRAWLCDVPGIYHVSIEIERD